MPSFSRTQNTLSATRPGTPVRARVLAVVVLSATALGSCSDPVGPGSTPVPRTITELPRALTPSEMESVRASNEFGLDLLREVAPADPGSSVFLSPLSASMALGMTMNGASGGTFEAMREALRFGELSEAEINGSYRGLLDLLTELDPEVDLTIGNAIWHRDDLSVREDFRARVEAAFDARVQALDFASPGAAEIINDWASSSTRGRIDEMVTPPLPGNVLAYLMNAVYFKAGWTEPFDADLTTEGLLHLADGSTEQVDLMVRDDTLGYRSADGYSAVDLPYAGGAFSMTLVVPDFGRSLAALVEQLDAVSWNDLTAGLRTTRVQLFLPRFELEWEGSFNDPLSAMGMSVAFDAGAADFSRLFESGAGWIDQVKQKSFVRVDEEGTEAAAVTSVIIIDSAPPQVRADRPFLFAIRERLSGTIVFLGLIREAPHL